MAKTTKLTASELENLRKNSPTYNRICKQLETGNLKDIPTKIGTSIQNTMQSNAGFKTVNEFLIRDWEQSFDSSGHTRYVPGSTQETEAFVRWKEGLEPDPTTKDSLTLEERVWKTHAERYPQDHNRLVLEKAREILEDQYPQEADKAVAEVITAPSAVAAVTYTSVQRQRIMDYRKWKRDQENVSQFKKDVKEGNLKEKGYTISAQKNADKKREDAVQKRKEEIKNARVYDDDPRYRRILRERQALAGENANPEIVEAGARSAFREQVSEARANFYEQNEMALAEGAAPATVGAARMSASPSPSAASPSSGPSVLQQAGSTISNQVTSRASDAGKNLIRQKLTGKAASTAASTAIKGATGKAISGGLSTAIAAGLAATGIGAVPGLVLKALTWLATNVIGKVLSKVINWIKENKEVAAALGLIGLGTFAGIPALTVGGGSLLILTTVPRLIAMFLGAALFTLIYWVVISIALTAIMLYIINNGAYITPPTPAMVNYGRQVDNPYIKIEKVAESSKPQRTKSSFQQYDNLPNADSGNSLTVTYTVTITAISLTLTDVTIDYDCQVIKDGPSQSCPSAPSIPGPQGGIINQGSPYSFSYTMTYGNKYNDSFITDVIKVNATAAESNSTAAGSATVQIGDPPDECPAGWPTTTSGNGIIQGPRASYSHVNLEAIDITVADGNRVYATHAGRVEVLTKNCEGLMVRIHGICQGKEFFSSYAHMQATSVAAPQTVRRGQLIGISDNTGTCTTGSHLHYQFNYEDGSDPNDPSNPPFMKLPYIGADVRDGCLGISACNVHW